MSTKTRRVVGEERDSKEQFLLLQTQQKVVIGQKLLECLQTESLPQVRHKIGDAVAEIARQYSDNGGWSQAELSRNKQDMGLTRSVM